jgi:hypothetical protein
MHTEFNANTAANASFLRAFDSWVCTTGINWEIGAVTAVDIIADDDLNVIRFDNGAELPNGVLGRTTTRFTACSNPSSPGGLDVLVNELDMVFNDAFVGDFSALSWEFGPGTATGLEIDFESVAVHELGHAHLLAHIINPGEVMHFAIANSQNSRDLGASDLAGAADVMDRNMNSTACGTGAMIASECSSLGVDDVSLLENIAMYPNPAKNSLNISIAPSLTLEQISIYDAQGRQVITKMLQDSNRLNTFDVSPLNTGLYFVMMTVNSQTISKKLVVE